MVKYRTKLNIEIPRYLIVILFYCKVFVFFNTKGKYLLIQNKIGFSFDDSDCINEIMTSRYLKNDIDLPLKIT